jgi:hypothetical protein
VESASFSCQVAEHAEKFFFALQGEKSFELDNYEAAFERLRSIPEGDAPPGTVVDNFIAAEDANMTLFNYTNELKQEAARLEEVLPCSSPFQYRQGCSMRRVTVPRAGYK